MFSTRASKLPAIDLIGASEFESSWPSTRISRFHAICSSSCSGWLTSASNKQRVRRAILTEDALRNSQRGGLSIQKNEWSGQAAASRFSSPSSLAV